VNAYPCFRRLSRCAWLRLAVVAALFLSLGTPAFAAECVIPQYRHPWAAFRPGSWKQVRVTTETLNDAGEVESTTVTETRSMLTAVDADSYSLQIDVTVEVGGKRFAPDTKTTRHGLQGESPGEEVKVRHLADQDLVVAGRAIRVHRAELEIAGSERRRVTRFQYADTSLPYVLARQSTTYNAAGQVQQETTVTTEEVNVPRILLGYRHRTWKTRTEQKHPAGRVVTQEVHAAEVPGGVVQHTSEEFDAAGKLLRRSTLELVNFGVAKEGTDLKKRRSDRKARHQRG
jgi:hypothetical protein